MPLDFRATPVSCHQLRALDLYERALHQFQTYIGDPIATIEQALQESPDFVLGHAFRATLLLLMTERRLLPEARRSVEAAEALSKQANARERGLTRAARCWLDGNWPGACRVWEQVLTDYPRDAFALQAAHLTDFLLGDAKNLCDRVARVLPDWHEDLPGYSYLLGLYAFGLEECNFYERAEDAGRQALAREARDAWAVHAVTHVMEMQGRYDEGIRWLTARYTDWAPNNGFAYHNGWHLALFHLERAEYKQALALYDGEIYGESTGFAMQMLDASALLWRLHLLGVDVGDRWTRLAEDWAVKAPVESGYYAFNDVHALLACLGDGRIAAAHELLGAMEQVVITGTVGINGMMTREVGLPLARGLLAFAQARYDEAIEYLLPVRAVAHRFGGSHAQRDLITQTLIEAALRGHRQTLTRHLLNERVMHKPHSPLVRAVVAKARAQTSHRVKAA